MARIVVVKNNTGADDTWVGQVILDGAEYTLDLADDEDVKWATNDKVFTDIGNDVLLISNGTSYLNKISGFNWLNNEREQKLNADGTPIVEASLRLGKTGSLGLTFATPDFSDRTTWYQKSERVTADVLVSISVDNLIWKGANEHWINIHHKKLSLFHKKIPKRDSSLGIHSEWEVTITIDDIVQTSDFTIDYDIGTVTFAVAPTGTVKATYSHNDNVNNPSEWLLVPPPGYNYTIEHSEIQFSKSITLADTIRFEVWAGSVQDVGGGVLGVDLSNYNDFHPAAYDAGYGRDRNDYRNVRDYINTGNEGKGVIPTFGDLSADVLVFPFAYLQAIHLGSHTGTTLRLVLLNNIPFTNADIACATFYVQLTPK